MNPLVECTGLVKSFQARALQGGREKSVFSAVEGVAFSIRQGETLALVGESGCGKSTTGRLLLGLENPTAGRVLFDGQDLATLSVSRLRALRCQMQMIFQDPYGSLNPRFTVGRTLAEPLKIHERFSRKELALRVKQLIETVGLSPEHVSRYPHEFSGGQRQRIAIARAVSVNPRFIVADEPVSALDISVQGQILNLLQELKRDIGLTMLFISHDLAVVRQISNRVAVMYCGRLVECAPVEKIFPGALHPYTRLLLKSVLPSKPSGKKCSQKNSIPDKTPALPGGCIFYPRCRDRMNICLENSPEMKDLGGSHLVACHLYGKKN